jgi:hypothetical protein
MIIKLVQIYLRYDMDWIFIKSGCLDLPSEIRRNMLCETNAIAFDSLQCNGHISVSQFMINSHPGEASFPE